jgi:hypothetical protein
MASSWSWRHAWLLPALLWWGLAGAQPVPVPLGTHAVPPPVTMAPPFDLEAARADDLARAHDGKIPLYGRFLPVFASPHATGRWDDGPGEGRTWRQEVRSPGAMALELFFVDVHLPDGAALFVHTPDGALVLGPYSAADVTPEGRLSTTLLPGDAAIIIYHEPHAVLGQGRLVLERIAHAYALTDAERAANCQVDVNCSEGEGWEAQRDAVVRIRVVTGAGTGWCTGTLMNNTARDCTPYILSAMHCTEESSPGHFPEFQFRFNFQRSACGSGSSPIQVLTGCTRVTDSNDGGGELGSDFVLLRLYQRVPSDFHAFYAGWDATNNAASGGVGIHHAGGNEKRISTCTTPLTTTAWWLGSGSHWLVYWSGTENGHGVTEPGSSGSPFFNPAGRVVGTLTGGNSCCTLNGCGAATGPDQPDKYGKMSYHWTNNPNSSSQKLRNFLSPGPNVPVFDGAYEPCAEVGVPERPVRRAVLLPNPTFGPLEVRLDGAPLGEAWLRVVDAAGRQVHHEALQGRDRVRMDGTTWGAGLYVLLLDEAGHRTVLGRVSVL